MILDHALCPDGMPKSPVLTGGAHLTIPPTAVRRVLWHPRQPDSTGLEVQSRFTGGDFRRSDGVVPADFPIAGLIQTAPLLGRSIIFRDRSRQYRAIDEQLGNFLSSPLKPTAGSLPLASWINLDLEPPGLAPLGDLKRGSLVRLCCSLPDRAPWRRDRQPGDPGWVAPWSGAWAVVPGSASRHPSAVKGCLVQARSCKPSAAQCSGPHPWAFLRWFRVSDHNRFGRGSNGQD